MTKPNESGSDREPLFMLNADETKLDELVTLVERMYGEKCTPEEIEILRKEMAGEDSGVIPRSA
jgi:hypothetical protein